MTSIRWIALLLPLLAARVAVADVIGVYKDWVAVTSTHGKEMTCMIWSQPKQSEGYKGERGEAFAFVTHQPAAERLNRVSFETGYRIGKPNTLEAKIGNRQFKLSASESGAWTRSSEDDAALIEAMRAGNTMTVTGNGPGGEVVKDSYSLYGFTAAYKAISAACKVP